MDRFKKCLFGFKVIYLLYLLLAFNSFVNAESWMNLASYVITLLGCLMILWMVFRYRRYTKAYHLWILIAFIFSYVISAFSHASYGFVENVKGTIWLVLPIVLVYLPASDMSGEEIRWEWKWISRLYILYCTIVNLISLSMVYWGRMYEFKDPSGEIHVIGYRWSRLWGVYDDPNHGATITVIALFMLIYLLFTMKSMWKRIAVTLLFVVNYLYVVLSDSRTGLLCLTMGILIGGIVCCLVGRKEKNFKRTVTCMLGVCLAAGIVFSGSFAVKTAYRPIDKKIVQILKAKNKLPKPSGKKTSSRKKDLEADYSNGRLEIWKNGLQIVESSPLIGVGYRNMTEYAKENLPEGYLVNNPSGAKYDSMHNLELDVLVSQGIVGGIIFLLFVGNICVIFFKNIRKVPKKNIPELACTFGIAGALGAAGTFLSFIFYVNAPQSFCFWLFLGYAMRYCQIGADGESV